MKLNELRKQKLKSQIARQQLKYVKHQKSKMKTMTVLTCVYVCMCAYYLLNALIFGIVYLYLLCCTAA